MEIYNTIANSHQPIQTKQEVTQRVQTTESQLNETNVSKQDKISDEKEEKKYNEKEIKKKLQEITEQLNKEMDTLNTTIRFGFNDKVEEMYVSVIDTKDNRVLRQIPSEEAMQLAAKMRELVGMLFDEKG